MNLKEAAERLGGICTFSFSQGRALKVAEPRRHVSEAHKDGSWDDQGKLFRMVLRGPVHGKKAEMGGVCATHVAFWIAFHSSQESGANANFTKGRSVWEYLYDSNGLNMGAATNIVVEHHRSSGNQDAYFREFLNSFKLKKRGNSMSGAKVPCVWMPFTPDTAFSVGEAIFSRNGYKMIQLRSAKGGGGHMIGAWSDTQDVLFMDPNVGEFWFQDKTAFKIWLSYFFKRMYGNPCRYNKTRIQVYAAA